MWHSPLLHAQAEDTPSHGVFVRFEAYPYCIAFLTELVGLAFHEFEGNFVVHLIEFARMLASSFSSAIFVALTSTRY